MNCKNCGELLEEGVTVCPACGAACEAAEPAEETVTEVTVSEEAVEENLEPVSEEISEETAEEGEASEEIAEEATEEAPTEAAPANPKRKKLLKVVAVVLAVVLALSLAAGIWHSVNGGWKPRENNAQRLDSYYADGSKLANALDTVVATCGDAQLTNSMLQAFYWNEVYRFLNDYSSYLSYLGLDLSVSMADQYVSEGVTYQQQFLETALSEWRNYQALAIMAKEAGFALSEASRAQIDAFPESIASNASYYGYASGEEMIQAEMGPGATVEGYMAYMELYCYAMEYFDSLYLNMNFSDEEITAYYEENADLIESSYGINMDSGKLIDVRHILVMPKSESGSTEYTDAEWEACRVAAEEILNQWKSGAADEDYFAQLATEKTEDPGSQTTGGLYTGVYEGQMVTEFNDWCFDVTRQYGDTGLVRTSYGYHVMFFVDGQEQWYLAAKQDMAATECSKLLEESLEKNPMEVEYKKIRLGEVKLG